MQLSEETRLAKKIYCLFFSFKIVFIEKIQGQFCPTLYFTSTYNK
jgi:hypothetical protein